MGARGEIQGNFWSQTAVGVGPKILDYSSTAAQRGRSQSESRVAAEESVCRKTNTKKAPENGSMQFPGPALTLNLC
jgi:hypothetical protein